MYSFSTLNFISETNPINFQTAIHTLEHCFDIRITEPRPFDSLDSFAEECFRQVIECAVNDGLLKSEFTPFICESITKSVIKNFKKLTDLESIDAETVISTLRD
jgi:hypothetical protein